MLTLITATGARPRAFALCERWMERQTFSGEIQWLVVDDCDPPTSCTLGQEVIRPEWRWRPGRGSTTFRTLLAALPRVRGDKVLIIEDDDWYSLDYLKVWNHRLDEDPMVGEERSIYYNVARRYWFQLSNWRYASLCQTGFRSDLLPVFERVCQEGTGIVDSEFWRLVPSAALYSSTPHCIGMKCMPGRGGAGIGHNRDKPLHKWKKDTDLSALSAWIGKDVSYYGGFYQPAET